MPSVNALLKLIAERRTLGARTDKTHIALKNIPELGDLVQTRLAHKLAKWRYARIFVLSPLGTTRFSIGIHAAELINIKDLAVLANATLCVNDRAFGFRLNLDGNNSHWNRKNNERATAGDNIKKALDKAIEEPTVYDGFF